MSKTQQQLFREARALIEKMDWWYERSDDHRVYERGRQQWNAMHDAMRQVTDPALKEMLSNHYAIECPYNTFFDGEEI